MRVERAEGLGRRWEACGRKVTLTWRFLFPLLRNQYRG